jgi:hypothetical protein
MLAFRPRIKTSISRAMLLLPRAARRIFEDKVSAMLALLISATVVLGS